MKTVQQIVQDKRIRPRTAEYMVENGHTSSTYNPSGREDGKKDPKHPQAYLHGRKLIETDARICELAGFRGSYDNDNGSDIEVGETVVVAGAYDYTETRCVGKKVTLNNFNNVTGKYEDLNTRRWARVNYRFRNVKKDGSLGKKSWTIKTDRVLIVDNEDGVQYDCDKRQSLYIYLEPYKF